MHFDKTRLTNHTASQHYDRLQQWNCPLYFCSLNEQVNASIYNMYISMRGGGANGVMKLPGRVMAGGVVPAGGSWFRVGLVCFRLRRRVQPRTYNIGTIPEMTPTRFRNNTRTTTKRSRNDAPSSIRPPSPFDTLRLWAGWLGTASVPLKCQKNPRVCHFGISRV